MWMCTWTYAFVSSDDRMSAVANAVYGGLTKYRMKNPNQQFCSRSHQNHAHLLSKSLSFVFQCFRESSATYLTHFPIIMQKSLRACLWNSLVFLSLSPQSIAASLPSVFEDTNLLTLATSSRESSMKVQRHHLHVLP